ncbi:GATA zinc finger domain-containing protein [Smittium mucronatum]|uniref:GATA zinc finger domain-containing protein n=1 Tax=Smittium mucronatum TaxID=133383 RepID=A0A1R0GX33_9FUNG|nr:GATA zinc finger domain-containing protein [Smittium mucronatum]
MLSCQYIMHANFDNIDSDIISNDNRIDQYSNNQLSPVANLHQLEDSIQIPEFDQNIPYINSGNSHSFGFDNSADFSFPSFNPLTLTISRNSSESDHFKSSPVDFKSIYDIPKSKNSSISKKRKDKSSLSKKSSSEDKKCSNCYVTETPLWRRTPDRKNRVCNACGLYFKQYNKHRSVKHNQGLGVPQFKDFGSPRLSPSTDSNPVIEDFSLSSKNPINIGSNTPGSVYKSVNSVKNGSISPAIDVLSSNSHFNSSEPLNTLPSAQKVHSPAALSFYSHPVNINSSSKNNNSINGGSVFPATKGETQTMDHFQEPSSDPNNLYKFVNYPGNVPSSSISSYPSEFTQNPIIDPQISFKSPLSQNFNYYPTEGYGQSSNNDYVDLGFLNPLSEQPRDSSLDYQNSSNNETLINQPNYNNMYFKSSLASPRALLGNALPSDPMNNYLHPSNSVGRTIINGGISISRNFSNSSAYNRESYVSGVPNISQMAFSVPETGFLNSTSISSGFKNGRFANPNLIPGTEIRSQNLSSNNNPFHQSDQAASFNFGVHKPNLPASNNNF